jgi:hypothetical protein
MDSGSLHFYLCTGGLIRRAARKVTTRWSMSLPTYSRLCGCSMGNDHRTLRPTFRGGSTVQEAHVGAICCEQYRTLPPT